MANAIIDACCLIDLLAAGRLEVILRATGFVWHLPIAVESEIQYVRRHDPSQHGQFLIDPVDLTPFKASGALQICTLANQAETNRFIHYASQFRSDGEAMCIAIAEQRGWVLATDDRKAIRVAQQAGLTVVSCPELLKRWADATGPDQATLNKVLQDIEILAQFRRNSTMPEFTWWIDQLAKTGP